MGKGWEFYQNMVKPVHPTSVNTHGLFGFQYVKQHMMTADGLWTPASITDEFAKMTDLLSIRVYCYYFFCKQKYHFRCFRCL